MRLTIDGVPINVKQNSRAMAILEDLNEGLPRAREGVQYLIEHLSGLKFEADPYINVNDILPVLKEIRLQLAPRFPEIK